MNFVLGFDEEKPNTMKVMENFESLQVTIFIYYNSSTGSLTNDYNILTENFTLLSLIELKISIYHELQGERTVRSNQI
ncbi:hypothetical protein L2E82_39932 [Cichorium intybus]|uniref:Uncharacterized protein n=1 Tax=Cichorium intybus TaxID=13427 RepID=A0ACB9AJX9_CICIN|nr:hypothetical protein L2E82_39932 [Cichorium intybus]